MSLRFSGTYTAIVTPFHDGATDAQRTIDWGAYERLVEAQIEAGIDGVVPCGTTGECPTLTPEEQVELVSRAVNVCAKARANGAKCIVMAGTGTNATSTTIARSQAAERAGADALMVVVPYYGKPSQEGLFQHYVAVAAAVKIPIVVYNIPGRTGIDLTAATLARIAAAAPNVVATKEATGNVFRAMEIVRMMGSRMTVLSGDDALSLPMISIGARGVISVTSNVFPAEVAKATRLALDGEMAEAQRAHINLCNVHEVMFTEANPGPAKAALKHLGKISSDAVRGPLVPVSEEARARVKAVVSAYVAGRG
jgi:4-hydroxy-tetrahydrodipicolinate synthase